MCKGPKRHFFKEMSIQMANRYIKYAPHHQSALGVREIQIKTTMRYHLTSFSMFIIQKKKEKSKCSKDMA